MIEDALKCQASPCDMIRARNDERTRFCEILDLYVRDPEAHRKCLDAIHGVYDALTPEKP